MRSLSKLINSIQSLIAFAKRFTLDFWQGGSDTPLDVQLSITSANHMLQQNLFDVVDSVILKFPAVLKFPADDL